MKFTYEDKLLIVEDYKELGPRATARKWSAHKNYVIAIFNKYKNSCLKPHSETNISYTPEFKLNVIRAYIQGEGSFETLANKFGVGSLTTIMAWYHAYQSQGEEGLTGMRKPGRPGKQSPEKKVNLDQLVSSEKPFSDFTPEEEKALREELLRLRCHEEFTKKFEALAQDYLEKKIGN